ncbi:MAG: GMC family oxidoreductase [Polyangia bacterium]
MNADRFDAVIIGSGFGGSVAACRLAQAGQRVLILERGQRYPQGSFPRSFKERSRWLYTEHEQGLVDVKPLVTEMIALQAAGYGGGSLLYNNVHIRAAPQLFSRGWPAGYDRASLDPYYDLVGYMLDITPISETQPLGLPQRTQAFRQAAESLGREAQFFLPNLAVNFSAPGVQSRNKFGVEQQGCTHCGECIVGCNRHAKNTLDLNYLAVAEQHGAVVRTRCQAERIEPAPGGGYWVHYSDFAAGQGNVKGSEKRLVCGRNVFVCAGAVNSTELLLRCRDVYGTLPHLSDRLGHGYSANGDFLAFVFHSLAPLGPTRAPGITSALLFDRKDGKHHTWFLLEDGGASEDLVRIGQLLDPKRSLLGTGRSLWSNVLRALDVHLHGPLPDGDLERCSVILVMGRDSATGTIALDPASGQLRLRWELPPNLPLYDAQARLASDVAKALGGEVAFNPLWKQLHQPITIHNLGGCNMADSPSGGVTDGNGEVFGHPGLFVLDGARVPVAIGANPSSTIAATAERSIEAVIRRLTGNPQWQAHERSLARPILEPFDRVTVPVGGTPEPVHHMLGLTFQETMRGFLCSDFTHEDDYKAAARRAHGRGQRAEFTLDITAPDLDAFLIERDHTAIATGTLHIPGFTGPQGAPVTAGVFNLFVETGVESARKMLYALPFYGTDGNPYLLDGWKDIRDHGSFDVWESTTTLYTTIREGHDRDGAVRALGTLQIDLPLVLQLVASMHVTGTTNPAEKAMAIERVGNAFFGTLWKVYVKPRLPSHPRKPDAAH